MTALPVTLALGAWLVRGGAASVPPLPPVEVPRIWVHLSRPDHALGVLAALSRVQCSFGPVQLVVSGAPEVLAALPPLPETALVLSAPLERRGAARAFLAALDPCLCLWSGGAFRPVLMTEWLRMGGRIWLIEADAGLLARPSGFALPGAMRALTGRIEHAWAVSSDATERLGALGLVESRITPQATLQIAPPVAVIDAEALDRLATKLTDRVLWCAVHPTEAELARCLEAQDTAHAISYRMLLAVLPRPGIERETKAALATAGRLVQVSAGTPPENRHSLVLIDDPSQAGLWLRLSALGFLGGSTDDAPITDPLELVGCGTPIAAGPDHAPHELVMAALSEVGALLQVAPDTALAQTVLQSTGPQATAERASAAWERITRGARASDELVERLLDVLEGAA